MTFFQKIREKLFSKNSPESGFTLVEIMVSVSIFATIMLISSGAILSVFDSNRKSQSLRSVMDNLNLSLEYMTRTIRFGNTYHCNITSGSVNNPRDCAAGATSMAVEDQNGDRIRFRLNNNHIERSVNGGSYDDLTSSDVTVTTLSFRVLGSNPLSYSGGNACPVANQPDTCQPKVIIVISGYAGAKPSSRSTFTLETSVSQRIFDSQ